MISENKLKIAFQKSWIKESSSDVEKWTKLNPSYGQCAVTALIVNDYLGGEIVWSDAILPTGEKISHYFNKINEVEIDFTKEQFPKGTKISKGIAKTKEFNSTREYILSYSSTKIRYHLLKKRVKENLK